MDKCEVALKILNYWYLVEFLDQPNFPSETQENQKINRKAAEEKVPQKQISLYYSFVAEKFNPVTILLQKTLDQYSQYPETSDEVSICFGKIKRMDCIEYLQQRIAQKIYSPEKDLSSISLIGLKCDTQGCYIEKSVNVSPLIWGIMRLQSRTGEIDDEALSMLLSVKAYSNDMQMFEDCLTYQNEDGKTVGATITSELLAQLYHQVYTTYLNPIWGNHSSSKQEGVLIYRRYCSEEDKSKDSESLYFSDLSKSFFTNDLHMLKEEVSANRYGTKEPMEKAVIDYIVGAYAEEYPEEEWGDFSKRVDIRTAWNHDKKEGRADFFNGYLDVFLSPAGKWPSKYMPAFMQQLAINLGTHSQNVCGNIFSVNGPPGTGKTTLLKEIIAGNIVERAKRLSEYDDPDDAFEKKPFYDGERSKNGYSNFHNAYYDFIDSEVKAYGMLVASCNNAAVENITKELPDGTALCKGIFPADEAPLPVQEGLKEVRKLFDVQEAASESFNIWVSESRRSEPKTFPDVYFTKYANDLAHKSKDEGEDRWGLISAPFGKLSNISRYAQKVLLPYTMDFGTNDKISARKEKYAEAVVQFRQQLAKVENLQRQIDAVSGSRKRFSETKICLEEQCTQLMHAIQEEQQKASRIENKINDLEYQLKTIQCDQQTAKQVLHSLQMDKEQQMKLVQEADKNLQLLQNEIMELEGKRNFKDFLFNLIGKESMLSRLICEKYKELKQTEYLADERKKQIQTLIQQLHIQANRNNELEKQMNQLNRDKTDQSKHKESCFSQVQQMNQSIHELKEKIQHAQIEYLEILNAAAQTKNALHQMTVLDETFWQLYDSPKEEENTKAQVLNPWFTEEYNREREILFYLALQLHKNFFLASKCCCWNVKNLLLMWRIIKNDEEKLVKFSPRDRQNCFGALLNTVFLLTPVLSTTFASAGTMLGDIKRPEEIGFLIIDEAGQAQPQMALGSFYRCRRAIVVGDPKQVEPVVTGEMDSIKRIIKNNFNAPYQSKSHSVQEFADRINPVGTYFAEPLEDRRIWVGCPLTVHRRCISPMYEISNAISYDNTMKQQTAKPKPELEARFCLESSRWINVGGTENSSQSKDHFVKEQGVKALELIREAFRKTHGIPNLFVISPFTTVKFGLKRMISTMAEYKTDKRIQEWAEEHIGTVHTFQGKEAEEVIFLLGCDKNALNAVRWVNNNIVNVAVTRAKYRLYIIGDYTVWQHSPVMQKVKCIMDSYALRALKEIVEAPEKETDKKLVEALLKQVPNSESFQVNGQIEEILVNTFQAALKDVWTDQSALTEKQMKDFGLSAASIEALEPCVAKSVVWSIRLYSLFALMKERFSLNDVDFACSAIMFCKSMELQLKCCLLPGLQRVFSGFPVKGKKLLSQLKETDATIGTFTHILKDENHRVQLAGKLLKFENALCNKAWWDKYYFDLDEFRELRNTCCHTEKFEWSHVEKLLENLFKRKALLKTQIGKNI